MRTLILSSLMLVASAASAAEPRVAVSFVEAEKFADFGHGRWDRERNEKDFAAMLQSLGERLPAGQTLSLRITDVNLAGEEEWWRFRGQDVRVMRNITWPMLHFDYRLNDASGQVLKSGSAQVKDMGYLDSSFFPARLQSDTFKYEQRMMERWVKDELLR
jgi:Protein of unknown function (DUF3016)